MWNQGSAVVRTVAMSLMALVGMTSPTAVAQQNQGGGFGGGGNNGPMVMPGTYAVSLLSEGNPLAKTSLTVEGDPEVVISEGDLKMRFEVSVRLNDMNRKANDAYNALFSLNEQLTAVRDKTKGPSAPEDLKKAVGEFEKEIAALRPLVGLPAPGAAPGGSGGFDPEAARRNVRQRISQLKGQIMGATMRPTDTQLRRVDENEKALAAAIEAVNALLPEASALFAKATAAGVMFDVPKPVKP